MKKFIKRLLVGVIIMLGCLSFSKAQNYRITDYGDFIRFRGSSAYSVSDISKDDITSIHVVSQYEVKITTGKGMNSTYAGASASFPGQWVSFTESGSTFTIDYTLWSNGSTAFSNITALENWLMKIWKKRYYQTSSYIGDSLLDRRYYWIFNNDTTEVTFIADTFIYDNLNPVIIKPKY